MPKCECENRVQLRLAPAWEVLIQPPKVKKNAELERLHPHEFEADSSDTSTMDLRDYLVKKRSAYQITLQCCCEWLIVTLLSECHCSSYTSKLLVFN